MAIESSGPIDWQQFADEARDGDLTPAGDQRAMQAIFSRLKVELGQPEAERALAEAPKDQKGNVRDAVLWPVLGEVRTQYQEITASLRLQEPVDSNSGDHPWDPDTTRFSPEEDAEWRAIFARRGSNLDGYDEERPTIVPVDINALSLEEWTWMAGGFETPDALPEAPASLLARFKAFLRG